MLTLSALLFAAAVAAPPKYRWEQKPAQDKPAAEQKKPEPKADKPKPPGLCKRFPYACTPELLLGPPDDYQHGGPDMGGGSGGF